MEEHEPFIAAIEAQPNDRTTRLVYADWLDERDHPAGKYLRAELELASLPEGSDLAPNLRAKLRTLRPRIEKEWLARFDQPRVMLANPTPFPAAWWAVELPGIRNFDATYQRFTYESLPPLRFPPFTGTFAWLPDEDFETSDRAGSDAEYKKHFSRLVQHLAKLGLTVPPDLAKWLTNASVRRIPSCTDCYCYRPWDVVLFDEPKHSRLVPFYIDSQGCITWYLYLTPEGYNAVLASGWRVCHNWRSMMKQNPRAPLDVPAEDEDGERVNPRSAGLVFVAPSVEAFFYRWRLENSLWYKLADWQSEDEELRPITPEEQAYIDFYREHPASET